jgi:hypothetical protein
MRIHSQRLCRKAGGISHPTLRVSDEFELLAATHFYPTINTRSAAGHARTPITPQKTLDFPNTTAPPCRYQSDHRNRNDPFNPTAT